MPDNVYVGRMREGIEKLREARDVKTFHEACEGLKEHMRALGFGREELLEAETLAYYPQNVYSDKETRENMETAKDRVITYIENIIYESASDAHILELLENFYLFLESLTERKPHKSGGIQQEQLKEIKIKNEYDVQHLLYACVKLLYPRARAEVTEDTGYSSVRTDIVLDSEHVIEVKCTRENMKLKKLTEEIAADMVHYSAQNLYFFLYDKEKIIENPSVFKETYEKKIKDKRIYIIIHQPKTL